MWCYFDIDDTKHISMNLDGTVVYCYCQWIWVGLLGRLLVCFGSLSFKLWKYFTSVNSHLSERASRALKTASNVPKKATGHDVDTFSHLASLQPVLSPLHPPSFIHPSSSYSLSSSIPFHTQFQSPVNVISVALDMSSLSSSSFFLGLFLPLIWKISN